MSTNESVQFHLRFVKEKHKELVSSLDDLVIALVGENVENKKSKAEIAFRKTKDLQASIAKTDAPPWLGSLSTGLNYFIGPTWNQNHMIDHLIKNIELIRNHVWKFENPSESAFDFDSIYEHYRAESRLPELFDEIVSILEEIEKSGVVDSLTMMKGLGKVIATLKKNRDGSYFSINSAWEFLVSFLKNYMWAELSNIPMLGTAMEALEKTIKETSDEMFKVHTSVEKEMRTVVEGEVKGLRDKSSFNFVSYDKQGLSLLGEPSSALSVNEKV
ncbi:hypothetical protein IC617_12060 [Neiella sp. HB171785]|uniref:Uncharacterized protein n=1 Tax=Neiella litorisoli TaxID=2771431 RepID=A0A8J6UGI0_9GAMM|nr:hypothetical protein [Neiella litorisoli]MBD1390166.1 hypothetical protein [Neiella litorisoli]